MKKFEGNINGKIYTDKKEFDKALSALSKTDDIYVSYKYISAPNVEKLPETDKNKSAIKSNENFVSEEQYIKNISNEKDVKLDDELISKLKNASNKSDIKDIVGKKITYFDNKITNNLIHINDLKSDYEKLEEKISIINSQIKTLDDANNNFYLHKEYYTNIKELFVEVDALDSNDECECSCDCNGSECTCDSEKDEPITITDICKMTAGEFAKHLNKNKIYTLGDLVEYFLKHY